MADIELKLSAIDEASKTVEALADKLVKLGEAYISIEGIKKLGEAIDEAQVSALRLDTILKNVGNIGVSRREMDNFSEALLKNSVYSRQAGQNMQAMLATFQNINGDQFKKAQQAIVDFASFRGMDLESAGRMIGRVLNEPAQALGLLTRMGVQFSTAQRDIIRDLVAVGEYAKAQDIILKKLTDTYSGTSEAMTNTLGGALKQLANNFKAAFEGEGANVNGVVEGLHTLTAELSDPKTTKAITDLVQVLVQLADVMVKLAAIKIPGGGADGSITKAIKEWGAVGAVWGANSIDWVKTQLSKITIGGAGISADPSRAADALRQFSVFLNPTQSGGDLGLGAHGAGTGLSTGPVREGASNDWIITFNKEYAKFTNEVGVKLHNGLFGDYGNKLDDPLAKHADEEMKKIRDAVARTADEIRRAQDKLFEDMGGPVAAVTRKYEGLIADLEALKPRFEGNAVALAQINAEINRLGEEGPREILKVQQATETWAIYQKGALDTLDHAFEGMFDHVDQGFSGMVKSFEKAIEQMVVKAAASDLAVALGLKEQPGAGGGSSLGGILGALGGLFGGGSGGMPHNNIGASSNFGGVISGLASAAKGIAGLFSAGSASSAAGAFNAYDPGTIDTAGVDWSGIIATGAEMIGSLFLAGGGTTDGGPTVIGEQGPELLLPPRGSSVVTAGQLRTMGVGGGSGGGGLHYNPITSINGTGLSADQLASVMAENNAQQTYELMRMLHRNGYRVSLG